jgi:diguanylate cyclase (GGDEF)-like protein/PAS domain S-box-containing protein
MNSTTLLEVLENLHTGVVIHAADTSIVFSNKRAAALLGLSEAQMLGKTAIDPGWHFVDINNTPLLPQEYPVSKVVSTREPLGEMVVGVIAPERSAVIWLLCTAFPEFDEQRGLQRIVVNFHDISALKAAQETLRASERTYRMLFETVPQGVVYQNGQGEITSANPAAMRILGLTLEQMQGRTSMDAQWNAIREDGSHFPGHLHPTMEALRTGKPVHGVVMGVSASGRDYVWISCSATPLFNHGKLIEVYAIFEDITDRKTLQTQVQQLAFYDPLTQLPNRRLLGDRMQQAIATARRNGNPGALLVVDLDNFKPLNDAHGHMVGDLLLVEVAARLCAGVRAADTVARFGGDEFVVVIRELPPAQALERAIFIAEKLREALALPYTLCSDVGGNRVCITHHCSASIGLALFDAQTADVDEVLRRADHAMYQSKHEGRNRVTAASRL